VVLVKITSVEQVCDVAHGLVQVLGLDFAVVVVVVVPVDTASRFLSDCVTHSFLLHANVGSQHTCHGHTVRTSAVVYTHNEQAKVYTATSVNVMSKTKRPPRYIAAL